MVAAAANSIQCLLQSDLRSCGLACVRVSRAFFLVLAPIVVWLMRVARLMIVCVGIMAVVLLAVTALLVALVLLFVAVWFSLFCIASTGGYRAYLFCPARSVVHALAKYPLPSTTCSYLRHSGQAKQVVSGTHTHPYTYIPPRFLSRQPTVHRSGLISFLFASSSRKQRPAGDHELQQRPLCPDHRRVAQGGGVCSLEQASGARVRRSWGSG